MGCTRASEALFLNYSLKRGNRINKWLSASMDSFEKLKDDFGFDFIELPGEPISRKAAKGGLMEKTKAKPREKNRIQIQSFRTQNWKEQFETGISISSPERTFGTLFHKAVSLFLSNEDLKPHLKSWVKKGVLHEENGEKILKMLKSLKGDSWFSNAMRHSKILPEREIGFRGEIVRPDLILLKEDLCFVIDFKTGSEKSQHHEQMEKYVDAVSSAFGLKTEAYLIYFDPLRRKKLDLKARQTTLF